MLRNEEACALVKFDITPIKPMYRFLDEVSKALCPESYQVLTAKKATSTALAGNVWWTLKSAFEESTLNNCEGLDLPKSSDSPDLGC